MLSPCFASSTRLVRAVFFTMAFLSPSLRMIATIIAGVVTFAPMSSALQSACTCHGQMNTLTVFCKFN